MVLSAPRFASHERPVWVRRHLFVLVTGAIVLAFFAAPWSFEHKAHAALHGLCAQRPSHTLMMGEQRLPFDSRMTGIYGGFLISAIYLVLRGRLRAWRLPSVGGMVLLGLFVGTLAVDGTNSLLVDLNLWHPYKPDNHYRLATGLLTGIALAVILTFVLSTTLWRNGRPDQAVVSGPGELLGLAALQLPYALLVLTGAAWLFVPVSLALLVAASLVLGAMALAVVVLLRYGDPPFVALRQIQVPATVALLLGLAVMGAIAGARFLLEAATHAPHMP